MGIAPLLRLFLRLFGFRFGLLRPAIRLYHRFANGRRVVRAHAAHVVHGVFPQIEGIVGGMNAQLDLFPDGVDFRDNARAVGGHDVLAHLGQLLQRGLVIILLIFQAAHEPTALAGNFGGVQREILLLGHFDGHGLEIPQERAAADGPAAGPQASQHFGLVPHADLPKFDAHFEHARQILHQFPEIHPAVGGEIEDNLAVIEGVFHAHQLHIQLMLGDFLLTDAEGVLFPLGVIGRPALVLFRCQAQHLLQGGDDLLVGNFPGAGDHFAEFHAPGGFHHHVAARPGPDIAGIKIINLARLLKADADDHCH